ncbi:hypothetical protein JKP88DRAFT_315943 [Tribonema minus]|uniref:Uncharacterized protein n=1 Tax=Tribonema minus TaxID=303371 RepID=A0A836CFE6_9STRA|nr:hypothetical protein JKP88DRAFT_315943 [Tribonema minus]
MRCFWRLLPLVPLPHLSWLYCAMAHLSLHTHTGIYVGVALLSQCCRADLLAAMPALGPDGGGGGGSGGPAPAAVGALASKIAVTWGIDPEHELQLAINDRRAAIAAGAWGLAKQLQIYINQLTGLPSATWHSNNKVLRLAHGTYFLGRKHLKNALMLRDCYAEFEGMIQRHFNGGGIGFGVIGNAGIGKSMLSYLLLYRWACERQRVVFHKRGFTHPVLLCSDGAFELNKADLARELARSDVIYLVDGMEPADPEAARLLLIASTEQSTYWEALKPDDHITRYMDTWSLQEIETCRQLLNSDQPRHDVVARYDQWGGNVRYVLGKLDTADQKALLATINSCTVRSIGDALAGCAGARDVSSRILHLRVQPGTGYTETYLDWASPWVAQGFAYARWQNERAELQSFVGAAVSEGELDSVCGRLFEGLCHALLAAGGTFRCRDLDLPAGAAADASVVELSAVAEKLCCFFDGWSEVTGCDDGVYCRPRAKNQAAVDAAVQPGALFQMTLNKGHGISSAALAAAVASMRETSQCIKLFFVAPPECFMSFPKQTVQKGIGNARLRQCVKQYALEMPNATAYTTA